MTSEQLLSLLQSPSGDLVPKRCTEQYLRNNNLADILDSLVDPNFGSIKDRIKHLKYGGGYCLVCNTRTKVDISGRGFANYCSLHFHQPKKGKRAHNHKEIDIDLVRKLYHRDNMSIIQISKQLDNISNVSLKKKMVEAGIELRTHSDNQKLHANRESVGPKIIIDRSELVTSYKDEKVPIAILADKYNCSAETIRRFLIQENVDRSNRRSAIEWKIIDILNRYSIPYRTNAKNIIAPFELDIYIPEHNLAIEINGLYTHSLYTGGKDKLYHHNKFTSCKQRDIRLLQLWENDINERIDVIESMIAHRCKISTHSIDARKCTVVDLTHSQLNQFCEENHIQGGPANNTKGIGLLYQDQIISVLGYLPTATETVIVRYCSKRLHNVRGGFGKLLARLPGNIVTYSSNDISWGELYSASGFTATQSSKYDLWYTDYQQVFNRQSFMKHKLSSHKLINTFDPDKSEIENMIANGFDAIYKSGTKTWRLNRA